MYTRELYLTRPRTRTLRGFYLVAKELNYISYYHVLFFDLQHLVFSPSKSSHSRLLLSSIKILLIPWLQIRNFGLKSSSQNPLPANHSPGLPAANF